MITVYPPETISLKFRFLDDIKEPTNPNRVVFALQKGDISEIFVYGFAENLICESESEGIYKISLQFLPVHWGDWVWHIEGGSPGDTLIPIGFLKSATGKITVLKPEIIIDG